MPAGELRERVAFDRRSGADDGAGNVEDDWAQIGGDVAARIRFLKGGETVVGQRLEGTSPAVVTVRSSTVTRAVTSVFRIRDVRSGRTFNVTAVTPDEQGAYLDILCTTGGADG